MRATIRRHCAAVDAVADIVIVVVVVADVVLLVVLGIVTPSSLLTLPWPVYRPAAWSFLSTRARGTRVHLYDHTSQTLLPCFIP